MAGVRTTGAPSWVSVTLSLSGLMLEASRDAWAAAAPGPGEMHPGDVGCVGTSLGQQQGAHKAPAFLMSHSLHSLPIHPSHTFPVLILLLSSLYTLVSMHPSLFFLLFFYASVLSPLLPTLPSPLVLCPNSPSEVIFLWCKSQQQQVNNLKPSGPFLSSYTCLPLN